MWRTTEADKRKRMLFAAASVGIILLYAAYSMMGFRWASTYIRTSHIITWKYGFIPRTLVNNIAYLILGSGLYRQSVLNVLILGTSAVFLLYIVLSVIETVAVKKSFLCMAVFLVFACSPYAKYYLHEAGYYEQYGYILGIILLEIARRKDWKVTGGCAAVFAGIAVLISETNLFLIIPFLFTIAFLKILDEKELFVKSVFLLFLGFVPSVVYSVLVFLIGVPKERMDKIEAWNIQCADFPLRSDVYEYFWNDRSNADSWGRALRAIPLPWVIYPLMLAAVVAVILYRVNKKAAIAYFVMSVLCGVAGYSIVIVAWDLDRYYFCIFMQVFMVTIYVLKRYLLSYRCDRKDLLLLLLFLAGAAFLSRYEFALFDERTYLRSIPQVLEELKKALP